MPPAEVRIIGGQWKRSKLAVVDLTGLRPTPDRVRVTLFDWLGQRLDGWRCLDAFAGSGALGFEAASRGAAEVLLLERDAGQAARLRETAARLQAEAVQVENVDAIARMSRLPRAHYDLVFVDPPFDRGLEQPALRAAVELLVDGGLVYLESDRSPAAADLDALGLQMHRQARAGRVRFQLLRRSGGVAAPIDG